MGEAGNFDAINTPTPSIDPVATGTTSEHELSVLEVEGEGSVQQQVAEFVDTTVGEARNAQPIEIASLQIMTALTAPDASQIENEAAMRLRLEMTNMPEGISQAFIIGTTMDGETARLVSQTCAVVNDRLKFCGEPVARIGSNEDGDISVAGYSVYTLGQLFGGNAIAVGGVDRGTQGNVAGFAEFGTTWEVADGVTVEGTVGQFGPDAYGRLAVQWAVREGIDLNLQVFIPEDGDAQPTLTLTRRF